MPDVTLTSLLSNLTLEDRKLRKAQALGKLMRDGSYSVGKNTVSIQKFTTWTTNGVTISATGVRVDGKTIWVTCSASDIYGKLPYPTGSRNADGTVCSYPYEYGFLNPPIRKWTRRPVFARVDGQLTVTDPGEKTEDIVGVIQNTIYEAVVGYARNHGWQG